VAVKSQGGPSLSPEWAVLLPRSAADHLAATFLTSLEIRGLSQNTLLAYGRALESLIEISGPLQDVHFDIDLVHHFLAHVRRTPSQHPACKGRCLAPATVKQRLVGLRAFADYLIDAGRLSHNPVTRGSIRRTRDGSVIPLRRGLIPSPRQIPRIPSDTQWERLVTALKTRSLRDKLMFALAYDGALRRNEVVTLRVDDMDFSARQTIIRPERSKNGLQRTIVYSAASGSLLALYLAYRRSMRAEGPFLFISESPRNRGKPLGGYTWGLVTAALARAAEVPGFSTHTLRHLRLTDLARAGLDVAEISRFAGHLNVETTMLYIHLSGRDMAHAFARASRIANRLEQLS